MRAFLNWVSVAFALLAALLVALFWVFGGVREGLQTFIVLAALLVFATPVVLTFILLLGGKAAFGRSLGMVVGIGLTIALWDIPLFTLWWPFLIRNFLWKVVVGHHSWQESLIAGFVIVLPYVIVRWLVEREIIGNWLESWPLWVKIPYTALLGYWFALGVYTQGYLASPEVFASAFLWNAVFFSIWSLPTGLFWLKFEQDEEKRTVPPRWVGPENETGFRYRFWLSFIRTVLRLGRFAFMPPGKPPMKPLGDAEPASADELREAGL